MFHVFNSPEKVQEIGAWLKTHPVSSLSRASCDLNLLDAAVIEKIEEEVESCKVFPVSFLHFFLNPI